MRNGYAVPDLGGLRTGWFVRSVSLHADNPWFTTAEVDLIGPEFRQVWIRLGERTPDVRPWLNTYLEAIESVPASRHRVDIDLGPQLL